MPLNITFKMHFISFHMVYSLDAKLLGFHPEFRNFWPLLAVEITADLHCKVGDRIIALMSDH